MSIEDDFWSHVEKDSESRCWIWTGARLWSGYGRFRNVYLAHIWAYKKYVGDIPNGYQIDHVCHNLDKKCVGGNDCIHRLCVNVKHLEAITAKENNARGRGNQFKDIKECKYGHPFTEENTYRFGPSRQWRGCRLCRNARRQGKDPATYERLWLKYK